MQLHERMNELWVASGVLDTSNRTEIRKKNCGAIKMQISPHVVKIKQTYTGRLECKKRAIERIISVNTAEQEPIEVLKQSSKWNAWLHKVFLDLVFLHEKGIFANSLEFSSFIKLWFLRLTIVKHMRASSNAIFYLQDEFRLRSQIVCWLKTNRYSRNFLVGFLLIKSTDKKSKRNSTRQTIGCSLCD